MENGTYIDDVRFMPGFLYPEEGPFANGEPVGWVQNGVLMDEDGDDREALLGYMAGEYFEAAGAGLLRYLGPDSEGIEPLFQVEGPIGKEWPVAWQEYPEITGEQFQKAKSDLMTKGIYHLGGRDLRPQNAEQAAEDFLEISVPSGWLLATYAGSLRLPHMDWENLTYEGQILDRLEYLERNGFAERCSDTELWRRT